MRTTARNRITKDYRICGTLKMVGKTIDKSRKKQKVDDEKSKMEKIPAESK